MLTAIRYLLGLFLYLLLSDAPSRLYVNLSEEEMLAPQAQVPGAGTEHTGAA